MDCWTRIAASLFIVASTAMPTAKAQMTVTWEGGSGTWFTPDKWSTNPTVPGVFQVGLFNVQIDDGKQDASNVILNEPAFAPIAQNEGSVLVMSKNVW